MNVHAGFLRSETTSLPVLFVALGFLSVIFLIPSITSGLGKQGDIFCSKQKCCPSTCGKNPIMCPTISCPDNTNGWTTPGTCVNNSPGVCKGKPPGGGLDQVAKMLGELMQKLMQSQQKAGGAGGAGAGAAPPGCQGSQVAVSDPSQLTNNPCAYYNPSLTGSSSALLTPYTDTYTQGSSVSDQLLGSLNGGSSIFDANAYANVNANTNSNNSGSNLLSALQTPTSGPGSASGGSSTSPFPQGVVGLVPTLPGVFGDIMLLNGGATIVAGTRSEQQNTQTSGFYGSESFGGQPQGLVGGWCQARPWASNFLSFIVPPAFFDSLCTLRGYQVGTPPPPQQTPSLQQTVIPASQSTTSPASNTPAGPTVPPRVDIWAVPAAVPLGARTTIFWNTQGVTNCTETSPDGSFNQSSLSGGAATVPITGATTFSISCDSPGGSHVTGYVVVNLSI